MTAMSQSFIPANQLKIFIVLACLFNANISWFAQQLDSSSLISKQHYFKGNHYPIQILRGKITVFYYS